ncbi:hypothetical protein NECAME_14416 [Necator americanus]|uniref:Uncharacterized protein n=1 Tax=Necator americanus TaxID=51031 RepID=W2SN62_NECAM|nr:hypothetical protein NECAME_14416 [Necator americanus]ETN70968.1 hypothetical protein NECAME_14416 [Necator americanus]
MWLRENVISPAQTTCKSSSPNFQDSKKVIYIMNRDEDHNLMDLNHIRANQVLIELQREGVLGKEPPELIVDLKSLRENADKATVPVRFCENESTSKGFDPEAELARALTAIIDDARIPLAEKQKKCELFKQHHPKMYRKGVKKERKKDGKRELVVQFRIDGGVRSSQLLPSQNVQGNESADGE